MPRITAAGMRRRRIYLGEPCPWNGTKVRCAICERHRKTIYCGCKDTHYWVCKECVQTYQIPSSGVVEPGTTERP